MTGSFFKKRQQRRLLIGMIAMGVYMMAGWLTGAVGIGSREIGLAVNTAYQEMAFWRFEVAPWLCVIAIPGVYMGAMEAVNISRDAEAPGNRTSHFWGKMFRTGMMAMVVLYLGQGILHCVFPLIYKLVFSTVNDQVLAAQITNGVADRIALPLMITAFVMDVFPSVGWYYMLIKKRLNVAMYGIIFTPLSMMLIGMLIRLVPTQFAADFTVSFEPFGWLLMFYGCYMHTKYRFSSIPE